jgi:hypothetical protein
MFAMGIIASASATGGSGGGLAEPPEGFGYVVDGGNYLVDDEGNYIIAELE